MGQNNRQAVLQPLTNVLFGKVRLPRQFSWIYTLSGLFPALIKFIIGCIGGGGFWCVSALHSALMGLARHEYFIYSTYKEEGVSVWKLLERTGLLLLLAGIVYGIYMCRLMFFQKNPVYEYYIGIPVVLVCFFDIGTAIRTVFMPMANHEGTIPLLVRKLVGLAGALPMMALAQIVLHAMLSDVQMSFYDGLTGGVIGMVIIGIGVWMLIYAKQKKGTY